MNVFGAIAVIKGFLPYFRARRRGHIVNITSMAALSPCRELPITAGSKFALEGIFGGFEQGTPRAGNRGDGRGAGVVSDGLGWTVDGSSAAAHC